MIYIFFNLLNSYFIKKRKRKKEDENQWNVWDFSVLKFIAVIVKGSAFRVLLQEKIVWFCTFPNKIKKEILKDRSNALIYL